MYVLFEIFFSHRHIFTENKLKMAAVNSGAVAATVGYIISQFDSRLSTPNLPVQIEVFAEANTANQSGLNTERWRVTTLAAAGQRYGWGSPIYNILRILFPKFGGGLGGIPVYVNPQEEAIGATAKVFEVSPVGTATENATHTVIVNGRDGVDAQFYSYAVAIGDTSAEITDKINAALTSVLGCPMLVSNDDYTATITSKWKGETADKCTLTIDDGGKPAGITYSVSATQSGASVPSIAAGLANIENIWSPIVINSYGENTTIMSAFELANGIADPINPTGRYVGTIMKPFIALTGSVSEDPSAITDARPNEMTISISPAPLSPGLPMEAAANDALVWAVILQNNPELDILYQFAPDMPVPTDGNIGLMSDWEQRDRIVQAGCSTVGFNGGKYQYMDPVTTSHPEGQIPPMFRYRRDLGVDFNIRYAYLILERINVVGKVIANDDDTINPGVQVIKPKMWKQILGGMFDDLEARGLIVDSTFSRNSLIVGIDANNPNRLNTSFRVKRSGIARISATEAETGFNFGSI